MLKRTVAIIISGILISTALGFQLAHAQTGREDQFTEKSRADVLKQGTGKDARVEVKLRDNTKVKGYISEAGQDTFTVMDQKTGVSKTVAYADVSQVKKQGGGLSSRTWIILGAVAAAVVVVGIVVKPAVCDGGAQSRFPC
ncbi:MAG: hypothetical protein WCB68_06270 [Pyrinomonadaceae bacterium]